MPFALDCVGPSKFTIFDGRLCVPGGRMAVEQVQVLGAQKCRASHCINNTFRYIAKCNRAKKVDYMAFGLDNFKHSPLGVKVGELLVRPTTITDMIALSRHGIPAVQDLGKPIMALGLPVTDQDKTSIGRWVREVMESNGWTTDSSSKSRVAAGNLFSTGAVYYPKSE